MPFVKGSSGNPTKTRTSWGAGTSGNPVGRKPSVRKPAVLSQCASCNKFKPARYFAKAPRHINGCSSYCNKCKLEKVNDWRARNPDRVHYFGHGYRLADFGKHIFLSARKRARVAGIPFDITVDEVRALVEATPVCPVLGIKLEFPTYTRGSIGGPRPNSYSIDRRIPALGYITGNVSIMSWRANSLKGDATLDELRKLVAWMALLDKS
jgi:hypothetical protein